MTEYNNLVQAIIDEYEKRMIEGSSTLEPVGFLSSTEPKRKLQQNKFEREHNYTKFVNKNWKK